MMTHQVMCWKEDGVWHAKYEGGGEYFLAAKPSEVEALQALALLMGEKMRTYTAKLEAVREVVNR